MLGRLDGVGSSLWCGGPVYLADAALYHLAVAIEYMQAVRPDQRFDVQHPKHDAAGGRTAAQAGQCPTVQQADVKT